eukprot:217262-Alexandrium_andersonii.AAC.1
MLIEEDVFKVGPFSQPERLQMRALHIRADLWKWYEQRRRQHPNEELYCLKDVSHDMFGTWANRSFRLKAAEAKTTLFY